MSIPASATAAASADPRGAELGDADRNSRNASLTLAFAQPGDTLLYLLLPLHHETFGVSLRSRVAARGEPAGPHRRFPPPSTGGRLKGPSGDGENLTLGTRSKG